jgi:hypothetical protein
MTFFALLGLLSTPSVAVNFYDGVRAPSGLYWVNYATAYRADALTGDDGQVTVPDFGYTRIEELARFSWYTPHATLCAVIPVGWAGASALDDTSWGVGDVSVGGGAFVPVTFADVLPMVFVKAPTGPWNADSTVNYGSNQWDLKPMVFVYRSFGQFTLDAALKGAVRFVNPKTGVAPGHEVSTQLLGGWRFAKRLQVGPSVSWTRSTRQTIEGNPIANSNRQSLSAGFDAWAHLSWGSVSVTYMGDVATQNAPRGHFFQVKTVWKAF